MGIPVNGGVVVHEAGGSGSGTVTQVSNADGTVVVSGTPTVHPVVSRAAITGDVTVPAGSDAATLVGTANVESIVRANSVDSLTPPAAATNWNDQQLYNLADPTVASDAATKNYVDLATTHRVTVISPGALPANTYSNGTAGVGATLTGTATGTLTVDGKLIAVGDTILAVAEATGSHNGWYVCTTAGAVGVAYVLTRVTEYDTPAQINPGDTFLASAGTGLGYSQWVNTTAAAPTIGTTALTFVELAPFPLYRGIDLTGGADVAIAAATDTVIATTPSLLSLATYLIQFSATILLSAAGTAEIWLDSGTGSILAVSGSTAAEDQHGGSGQYASVNFVGGVIMFGAGTLTVKARTSVAATAKHATSSAHANASGGYVRREA